MSNIPSFGDFGISSTFDAVLRYLPIFFCGITVFVDIFCDIAVFGTPQCPPLKYFKEKVPFQRIKGFFKVKEKYHSVVVFMLFNYARN